MGRNENFFQDGLKRRIILAAYEEKYPKLGKAKIEIFYDRYSSGAIVAMLSAENASFDQEVWTETVDEYEFNYYNSNRIVVLYENEFYTLTDAYAQGYISTSNLLDIYYAHRRTY